jgi:hypothetical protein
MSNALAIVNAGFKLNPTATIHAMHGSTASSHELSTNNYYAPTKNSIRPQSASSQGPAAADLLCNRAAAARLAARGGRGDDDDDELDGCKFAPQVRSAAQYAAPVTYVPRLSR